MKLQSSRALRGLRAAWLVAWTLVASIGRTGLSAQELRAEDLRYERRETRDASRRATLENHPDANAGLLARLDYQLDSDFPRSEEDRYYRILRLPPPEGVQFEPGGLAFTDDDRLVAVTRAGDVYLVDRVFERPPYRPEYKLFASGLHECLGATTRGAEIYVTQRGEVTRLSDLDGDDRADLFETVGDGWGLTGDYHEYAFGSTIDAKGRIWVVLCLTGSFSSQALFRGWCVTVDLESGETRPVASGIRSPGGIGANFEGDFFYTDNQGTWNGTSILRHVAPGTFLGNPEGNRWYDVASGLGMGPRPRQPESGSRYHIEADRIPEMTPPAIFFPYGKMGQSASGVLCDRSEGRFGPFARQLFVSDQTHSTVMRCFLEKVGGRYQGATFMFRRGFGSGNVAMTQARDGSFFIGGTERGWGARGGQPFALERLVWTGATPFEMRAMRARPDGFELELTGPADPTSVSVEALSLKTYTYIYQSSYGSPEVDGTQPKITSVSLSDDGRRVRLVVDALARGHVHELVAKGLRARDGRPLLHPEAYYTLMTIPSSAPQEP